FCVSTKNLFCRCIGRNPSWRLPVFVINANTCEKLSDLVMFLQRSVFIWDMNDSHSDLPPSPATRLMNVVITACMLGSSNYHFHEKLQNFNMACGLLQAHTPTIKPVSA